MAAEREATGRRTVLYVEDNPINAMLMGALFERRPRLQLVVAATGAQAVAKAERLNPVLLLLDMRLPDCHGTELLPRLRQVAGCEAAPAVAVTAEPDFQDEDSGFAELWPKPLDLNAVLQRLDALTEADGTTSDRSARPHVRAMEPFGPSSRLAGMQPQASQPILRA